MTLMTSLTLSAQTTVMEVNTKKLGAPIQPTMYGLFFEDINYAADGGLYGELVKNRSFEFPDRLMGWEAFGTFEVKADGPFERCPHYVERNTVSPYGPRHLRVRERSSCSSSTALRWRRTSSLQRRS